jgi:hypothetical protein
VARSIAKATSDPRGDKDKFKPAEWRDDDVKLYFASDPATEILQALKALQQKMREEAAPAP